ncbi:unnamed protein product [Schistosoma curassoni]|uniref:Gelsolin-like domain-containing protein n=1 Tax=Schistosoma curassoni TaxID=6186 RepID=A0A183K712_9TREM|nr:unnamed protein product [Schistosoma curassoni]
MDAAYLLDNGIYLIMWIGPNISSEWIQAVFNVQNPEHFESEKIYDLCNFDNEISRNLCTLLKKVRKNRWHYSRVNIFHFQDIHYFISSIKFFNMVVRLISCLFIVLWTDDVREFSQSTILLSR